MTRDSDLNEVVTAQVASAKSIRHEVPRELDLIISGLLSPSPHERYQSANDMLSDLFAFRYKEGRPIGAIVGTDS
jgi:hypothetical protein